MTRTARNFVLAAAFLFIAGPIAQAAQPQTHELTQQFKDAGYDLPALRVVEVGGIVVIRGRADEASQAEALGTFAQSLGYSRVANLVQVLPAPDDRAIERIAERELTVQRSLDGCKFRVDSSHGVLHLAGTVQHELQKDVAIQLVRNIDGVREVRASLNRF